MVEGEDGLSASGTQRSLSFPRGGSRKKPSLAPGGWGGRQSEAGPVGGGNQGSLLPTLQSRDPHDCPLRQNSSNLLALFLINTKDLQ